MKLKISEIQIVPVKPTNGLVAFASFLLNESIYFGSIGIVTRPYGSYRLVYPTKKVNGKNLNLFYPINKDIGQQIEEAIVTSYEDVMKNDRHSSFDNT
jgi:DNA-binding cell septation regulator SpoVG